ncbi:MAG: hypothetical protein NTV22_06130, partial [bacterium]|nr:hypothetical protein [bacterium]
PDEAYRVWHALLHACVPLLLFCCLRVMAAPVVAAWLGGMLAALIPIATTPVYGNSLSQSAGLVLLCLLLLAVVQARALPRLQRADYARLLLLAALGLLALFSLYRELLIYVLGASALLLVARGLRWCCTSRRRLGWAMLGLAGGCTLIYAVIACIGPGTLLQYAAAYVTQYFPYLNQGDISTRLSPLTAFGGSDFLWAAYRNAAAGRFPMWSPYLSLGIAGATACIALTGLVCLRGGMADLLWSLVALCSGLYVALALVVPWPYALKKHLSVCALVVALCFGLGCARLLRLHARLARWLVLVVVAAILCVNGASSWSMFAALADYPHYFDAESAQILAATRTAVATNNVIFIDTDERIEKFLYTLRQHRVINTTPLDATFAIVRRDFMPNHRATWLASARTATVVAQTQRYLLLRRTPDVILPSAPAM